MTSKKWKLQKAANCYNCGDATIHNVEVDQYNLTIRCRDCGFSRLYAFHMVDLPNKCDL